MSPNRGGFGFASLIHSHAALQRSRAGEAGPSQGRNLNRRALLGLVDSLQSTVRGLRLRPRGKGWATYLDHSSYTPEEFERKARLVAEFLKRALSQSVSDLGANTGYLESGRVLYLMRQLGAGEGRYELGQTFRIIKDSGGWPIL